ncbi:hypothetical protein NECAME_10646 [Necator americanus]|uniref:Uncharacterized protein n=1 Tax=Necator americanus TaxID=51031 RepID=W2TAF1_NECAM|nr:hypothetical protein NECAME_10646 [Necator americanus]ETN77987.1 hypothetical protein NECAME_10646 [Necator americanus]
MGYHSDNGKVRSTGNFEPKHSTEVKEESVACVVGVGEIHIRSIIINERDTARSKAKKNIYVRQQLDIGQQVMNDNR